jgi:hypothetical protein
MRCKTFTKDITITYFEPGVGFGLKTSVLRQTAQHSMRVQYITCSHAHPAVYDSMRTYLAVIAYDSTVFNNGEWPDQNSISQNSIGSYVGCWMN